MVFRIRVVEFEVNHPKRPQKLIAEIHAFFAYRKQLFSDKIKVKRPKNQVIQVCEI